MDRRVVFRPSIRTALLRKYAKQLERIRKARMKKRLDFRTQTGRFVGLLLHRRGLPKRRRNVAALPPWGTDSRIPIIESVVVRPPNTPNNSPQTSPPNTGLSSPPSSNSPHPGPSSAAAAHPHIPHAPGRKTSPPSGRETSYTPDRPNPSASGRSNSYAPGRSVSPTSGRETSHAVGRSTSPAPGCSSSAGLPASGEETLETLCDRCGITFTRRTLSSEDLPVVESARESQLHGLLERNGAVAEEDPRGTSHLEMFRLHNGGSSRISWSRAQPLQRTAAPAACCALDLRNLRQLGEVAGGRRGLSDGGGAEERRLLLVEDDGDVTEEEDVEEMKESPAERTPETPAFSPLSPMHLEGGEVEEELGEKEEEEELAEKEEELGEKKKELGAKSMDEEKRDAEGAEEEDEGDKNDEGNGGGGGGMEEDDESEEDYGGREEEPRMSGYNLCGGSGERLIPVGVVRLEFKESGTASSDGAAHVGTSRVSAELLNAIQKNVQRQFELKGAFCGTLAVPRCVNWNDSRGLREIGEPHFLKINPHSYVLGCDPLLMDAVARAVAQGGLVTSHRQLTGLPRVVDIRLAHQRSCCSSSARNSGSGNSEDADDKEDENGDDEDEEETSDRDDGGEETENEEEGADVEKDE